MNLTEEQLDEITQMAYHLIEPAFIAINIEADEVEFIQELKTTGSPARTAFYKGYLRQLVETRKAIIRSAQNGSNPSIDLIIRYFQKIEQKLQG